MDKKFECISEDFEVRGGTLIRYRGDGGHVLIPDGIDCISRAAFMGCKNLGGVYIREGVKRIEVGAFYGCDGLNDVYIADSVSKFGSRCFGGCTAIKNLRLPDGMIKNINYLLIDLDSVPEHLFINESALGALRGQFRKAAVRGFLYRSELGGRDTSVTELLWHEVLKNSDTIAAEFDGYLPFFRFVITVPQLSDALIDVMLQRVESLECRALLLERKRKNADLRADNRLEGR